MRKTIVLVKHKKGFLILTINTLQNFFCCFDFLLIFGIRNINDMKKNICFTSLSKRVVRNDSTSCGGRSRINPMVSATKTFCCAEGATGLMVLFRVLRKEHHLQEFPFFLWAFSEKIFQHSYIPPVPPPAFLFFRLFEKAFFFEWFPIFLPAILFVDEYAVLLQFLVPPLHESQFRHRHVQRAL